MAHRSIWWIVCKIIVKALTLSAFIETEDFSENTIPKLLCHIQGVEKVVKLVAERSAAVCGEGNRDDT